MRKASAGIWRASRRETIKAQLQQRCLSTAAPHPNIQLTTLPNKIRVATENTPGHFSSVGLYIDAGARYETPHTSGVSHFLDRMAFKVCYLLST